MSRACLAKLGSGLCVVRDTLFEYDTPKFVHIKNKKVGVVNRLVQLCIIGYIIGYGIVWQNGAQKTESVQSVVTTKVKGASAVVNASSFMIGCPELEVMDHIDLIVPPQEPDSFFVTTNMWVTCGQKYSECPEDPGIKDAYCTEDANCTNGTMIRAGNGVTTGVCNTTTNSCMINAWCPVEIEDDAVSHQGPKIDSKEFTVLVKNSISFPVLDSDYRVRNIPESANETYLKGCSYNSKNLFCPIFTLKQIVNMINSSDGYYEMISTQGAVVGLGIHWDCNLDRSASHCKPKYSARRLDNPKAKLSPGFNFRYPRYYYENGELERDIIKAYGIKFVIEVTGQGRKFDFTTLILALGSMVALLALATLVTDVIALYIIKHHDYYRTKKYQAVDCTNETRFGTQDTDSMYGTRSPPPKNENYSSESTPILRKMNTEKI